MDYPKWVEVKVGDDSIAGAKRRWGWYGANSFDDELMHVQELDDGFHVFFPVGECGECEECSFPCELRERAPKDNPYKSIPYPTIEKAMSAAERIWSLYTYMQNCSRPISQTPEWLELLSLIDTMKTIIKNQETAHRILEERGILVLVKSTKGIEA